jgi:hypothetical protein
LTQHLEEVAELDAWLAKASPRGFKVGDQVQITDLTYLPVGTVISRLGPERWEVASGAELGRVHETNMVLVPL